MVSRVLWSPERLTRACIFGLANSGRVTHSPNPPPLRFHMFLQCSSVIPDGEMCATCFLNAGAANELHIFPQRGGTCRFPSHTVFHHTPLLCFRIVLVDANRFHLGPFEEPYAAGKPGWSAGTTCDAALAISWGGGGRRRRNLACSFYLSTFGPLSHHTPPCVSTCFQIHRGKNRNHSVLTCTSN